MAKEKKHFSCNACGASYNKWLGQCRECGEWDSISEQAPPVAGKRGLAGYTGTLTEIKPMSDVQTENAPRMPTGMSEVDRVLGGGLVPGSVVLVGGDPGIGKSTVLLQIACVLSKMNKTLYVTGEESLQQIALRAKRLGLPDKDIFLLGETQVEAICAIAEKEKPQVLIIDSIQTMQVADIQSAPGSVSQVRESAAYLTQFAKQTGAAIFLVGHVTKSGDLAGPRVLEHIIDVVCYLESTAGSRFRMLRAVKNRYGAVNELGVFAMTETGLREISNPSAIFLTRGKEPLPGSIVTVTWEGSRPLLVEIQALVDESYGENPRRVTVGFEHNRLSMLLAVLHRHGGVPSYNQDVFVNAVGGVRILETAGDLALLLAVVSSMRNRPLAPNIVVFGEVGLAGEIRPVPSGQERLQEAAKHGFTKAIIPVANAPAVKIKGLQVIAANRLKEALEAV